MACVNKNIEKEEQEIENLKRIVLIGASDTSISCLKKILSTPYFDFKNLTLISSHGLPDMLPRDEIRPYFFLKKTGPALGTKMGEEWYQNHPFRNQVNVVYGTVTKILRKIKVVVVDGTKVVPYDFLIIATGRQFIRPDSPLPNFENERLLAFKRKVKVEENKENSTLIRVNLLPKPKNLFLINTEFDAAEALSYLRHVVPTTDEGQIIVHGACLEAYCCLRALIELNIPVSRITFIKTDENEMDWEKYHSFRDTPILRSLMNKTREQLEVDFLDGYDFSKWNVDENTGLIQCISFKKKTNPNFKEDSAEVEIECLAYIPFVVRRIDDVIASAVTSACLPYKNAILIDQKFETNDPYIMAAGPCTAYNTKLCAEKLNHCYYSSYEIGQLLGEFIMKKLVPLPRSISVNIVGPDMPSLPPLLLRPLVHYGELPGNWYYMHVCRPGWVPECCRGDDCECEVCECGTQMTTGSIDEHEDHEQKYFRIRFDKYRRVEVMECISRQKYSPTIGYIYGQHESILNRFTERVEKGEITDLYDHFSQPWAAALLTEQWTSFREEIQNLMETYEIEKDMNINEFIRTYLDNLENEDMFKVDPNILRHIFENTKLKAAIEGKFLSFIRDNKESLPMYARPDFVEETYKERLQNPLYVPQHKNFGL